MKFKDEITKKWSLECKDSYEPIKQKITFNNPYDSFRKRILFKGIVTSIVSIIFVGLLLGLFNTWDFLPKFEAPGAAGDSQQSGGSSMGSEGSNEFEGEAGAPGASSKGEYVLFIEELDKLNFNEIYVENITWHTSNLVPSGSGNNLVLYKECFKVLNELEFTKTSEDNINFNYWLIVNGDWCTIYIGEHNYVALEYDNNYHVYETNSDNVYGLLKDILK